MGLKELKEEDDAGVKCVLNERVVQRQEKEALDQGSRSTLNMQTRGCPSPDGGFPPFP